jgi:hypothetical protein
MKNTVKLFGIIALVVVIGFSMTACDNNGDDTKTASATVTANSNGEIEIVFGIKMGNGADSVSVTTDLPTPNDNFTLNFGGDRKISGLEVGQEVTVTATVSSGSVSVGIAFNGSHAIIETY